MDEEQKKDKKRDSLTRWAGGLTLATLVTGGMALAAAPVNATIATEICCGFGAIALYRSVREKEWILAVGVALIMAFMVMCTVRACLERENAARQMQRAFGN